jgi:hypothetical protein
MTHPRLLSLGLLLPLLAVSLFLTACERDKVDMNGPRENIENDPLTLDDNPGSVNLTPNAALSITPGNGSVKVVGDALVFSASGGYPPYSWGVGNPDNGSIDVRSGNPAVYVCLTLKQNSIYVRDSRGSAVAASITVTTL